MKKSIKTGIILLIVGILMIVVGLFSGARTNYDIGQNMGFLRRMAWIDEDRFDKDFEDDEDWDDEDWDEQSMGISHGESMVSGGHPPYTIDHYLKDMDWIRDPNFKEGPFSIAVVEESNLGYFSSLVVDAKRYKVKVCGIEGDQAYVAYERYDYRGNPHHDIDIEQEEDTLRVTAIIGGKVWRKNWDRPHMLILIPRGRVQQLQLDGNHSDFELEYLAIGNLAAQIDIGVLELSHVDSYTGEGVVDMGEIEVKKSRVVGTDFYVDAGKIEVEDSTLGNHMEVDMGEVSMEGIQVEKNTNVQIDIGEFHIEKKDIEQMDVDFMVDMGGVHLEDEWRKNSHKQGSVGPWLHVYVNLGDIKIK